MAHLHASPALFIWGYEPHRCVQGTNAHMLLAPAGSSDHAGHAAVLAPSRPWQRTRLWPSVVPHAMLSRSASLPRMRSCTFEAQLLAAGLSFLWDHQVQGTAILPGAALLEMAHAAAHLLAASTDQQQAEAAGSDAALLLQDSTIPTPVVLSATAAAMQLQVELRLNDGSLALRGVHAQSTHLATRTSQWRQADLGQQPARRAGVPASVAAQLASLLARSAAAGQPAFQTGGLMVDPRRHADGFRCHPAVMDGCLHLGASLAQLPASGSTPDIRVPVGLKALTTGGSFRPLPALELHGACLVHGPPDERGTAVSSYRLQQAARASAAAALALSGLEARPIRLPAASKVQHFPATPVAAGTAGTEQEPAERVLQLLYRVQWEAAGPAGQQRSAAARRSAAGAAVAISRGGLAAERLHIPAAAAAAPTLSCLLATLQQAARGGLSVASVCLATLETQHAGSRASAPLSSTAGAAAWGMLRVAAAEVPSATWAAADLDCHAIGGLAAAAAAAAVDVSGTVERGGLALRPMLLPVSGRHSVAHCPEPSISLAGRVLVTGGLGGELLACCLGLYLLNTGRARTRIHHHTCSPPTLR